MTLVVPNNGSVKWSVSKPPVFADLKYIMACHKVSPVNRNGGMKRVIDLALVHLSFVEFGPVLEAPFPHFPGTANLDLDVNQHRLFRPG